MTEPEVIRLLGQSDSVSLQEQLALLADLTQSFATSLDIGDTLALALARFMEELNAEAASIFLLEEDRLGLVCHRCAGPVDIAGLRIALGEGIVGKSIRDNACQMVRDVRNDPAFNQVVDANTGFETRSILCVPLTTGKDTVGAIELINKRGGDGLFNDQDRDLVVALASSAALAINNARMAEQLVEKERLEKELELAREIQQNLLPVSADPEFPIVGLNIPAWEVSGDFYDFLQLPDGRIYFNLADVSGKGMNAALLMAKTSSLLHCLAKVAPDPSALLETVNREVCETASHGMFVTIVSGFIDPLSGMVTVANAGHQPSLLHTADGVFVEYAAQAPPLGILPDTRFPTTEFLLGGGSLYLFTDGVTESESDDGRQLDMAGLRNLIKESSTLSAARRLENIVAEVRRPHIPQKDDITLMIIEQID